MKHFAKSLIASLFLAPMFASAATVSPGGPIILVGPVTISHGSSSVTCTMGLTGTISASNGSLVITKVQIPDFCGTGGGAFYTPNVSSYWTSPALSGPAASQYTSTLSGFSVSSGTFFGPPPPTHICAGPIPLTWDSYGEKITISPTTITGGGYELYRQWHALSGAVPVSQDELVDRQVSEGVTFSHALYSLRSFSRVSRSSQV